MMSGTTALITSDFSKGMAMTGWGGRTVITGIACLWTACNRLAMQYWFANSREVH